MTPIMQVRPIRAAAFSLMELLIVVVLIGIAAAIVIPMTTQAAPLRLQALARQIVADIMQVQSDSITLQRSHAIIFSTSGYVMAPVTGTTPQTGTDVLERRSIGGTANQDYANITVSAITFPGNILVFDAMGCPVQAAGSDQPASDAYIEVASGGEKYRIWVRAFTGGVEVKLQP